MKTSVAAIAASLLLAGCASGPDRILGAQFSGIYAPGLVSRAGQSGTIPVVVNGTPIGGGAAAAIVGTMRLPGWIGDERFVLDQAAKTDEGYRFVLVFGPSDNADPCAAPNDPGFDAGTGGTLLRASFCLGPQLISSVLADGSAIKGPTDPAFQPFMHQVIAALLPSANPLKMHTFGSGA